MREGEGERERVDRGRDMGGGEIRRGGRKGRRHGGGEEKRAETRARNGDKGKGPGWTETTSPHPLPHLKVHGDDMRDILILSSGAASLFNSAGEYVKDVQRGDSFGHEGLIVPADQDSSVAPWPYSLIARSHRGGTPPPIRLP